jgi:hypothetical protein
MALGSTFGATPAAMEENAQRARKRLPTQQALQTLSMQLPKVLGGTALPASDRSAGAYRPGGLPDSSAAQMQRMIRAMSGRKAGEGAPQGPRFQGGGPTTPPPAAAPPPMASNAAPGPKPPVVVKPPVKKPVVAKPPARTPGREAPERGEPGYVDSIPNPPRQMVNPVGPTPPPTQAPPPDYASAGAESNTSQSGVYGTGASGGYNSSGQTGYYDGSGNYIASNSRPYGR